MPFCSRAVTGLAVDGANPQDHEAHRRARHRYCVYLHVLRCMLVLDTEHVHFLWIPPRNLSLFLNRKNSLTLPECMTVSSVDHLCYISQGFSRFFHLSVYSLLSTFFPALCSSGPSIFYLCVSQVCCVTCCGQIQTRMYKAGERTTAGSPSPSEQMWSVSS